MWDLDIPALAAARERAGRRHTGILLAREHPHTRSEFERAFLRFLRRHGLPRPSQINQRVGRFRVDAVYPGAPPLPLRGV